MSPLPKPNNLHPQLAEQLNRLGLEPNSAPNAAGWAALLSTISKAFEHAERHHSELWSRLTDSPDVVTKAHADLAHYCRTLEQQLAFSMAELDRLEQMLMELEAAVPRSIPT
ncbi:MAG: hypothetical protein ACREJO_12870 [Phycisphaerales bacterium]